MSPRPSLLTGWLFPAPRLPVQILAAVGASFAGAYVLVHMGDWRVTMGLLGVGGFALLGVARPAFFLGLFLVVRPLLDDLGTTHVGGLNAAGALGVLLVFAMSVLILSSRRHFRPHGTAPFAAVLVVSVVACVPAVLDYGSQVHAKPLAEIVRLAAMIAVYVMAAQLFATPRRLTTLFVVVGLSGVIPAALGIKELIHGGPKAEGLDISRISGPFTGPNSFGMFLALTALVLIGLPRKALPTWVRLAALAPILVALVATYSRAGWALFLFGFAVYVWRRNPALIGVAAVTVALLIAFVPSIHDRVLPPNAQDSSAGGITTPESYQFRLNNWNSLLSQWSSRPLTGYGLETTRYVNPRRVYDPTGTANPEGYDAHNSVVKLLVEGGVVLLAVWVCLLGTMTARFRALARRDWEFAAQARMVFVLWISAIMIGLSTDDPLAATAMMYALFALSGGIEGANRLLSRGRDPAAPSAAAPVGTTSR